MRLALTRLRSLREALRSTSSRTLLYILSHQFRPLPRAKAMLFVDDDQSQVLEVYGFLYESVRAYQDWHISFGHQL